MVKVVFTGDNWEDVKGTDVYLPRPLRKELAERLLREARRVYMPPSTWKRLSKKVRERYRDKVVLMSMRGRFSHIPPEKVAEVAALRRAGLSIRKIALETGLPKSTVHYIVTYLTKVEVEGKKVIF